jgi:hypothetical protein
MDRSAKAIRNSWKRARSDRSGGPLGGDLIQTVTKSKLGSKRCCILMELEVLPNNNKKKVELEIKEIKEEKKEMLIEREYKIQKKIKIANYGYSI